MRMTRRYLYIEKEEEDPKIEGYDFSLADPPYQTHRRFSAFREREICGSV